MIPPLPPQPSLPLGEGEKGQPPLTLTRLDKPVVGVLGAGQLGRMLALAGYPLGVEFVFLDPGEPAEGPRLPVLRANFDDTAALDELAERCTVVTYEFENVPVASARYLAERLPVYPPPIALETAQDRLAEKSYFLSHGGPTAPFLAIDTPQQLSAAVAQLGLPAVLKTRRGGYDGKGQWMLRGKDEVSALCEKWPGSGLILEGYVPFTRELSILGCRSLSGEIVFYPLTENHHVDGILDTSIAPAPGSEHLQPQAEALARKVLEGLDYVGLLAIELFQVGDELWANEMAPRVHNSGHWTIEGATTSQFENHVRAVCGWPLGPASTCGVAVMRNLIGALPDRARILSEPGLHYHWYGKQAREGRKLGHVTMLSEEAEAGLSRTAWLSRR